VVFAQVNDFHNWKAWSPWAKRDPAMEETHEGAASGTGAIYSWRGNSQVGHGRMTISESRPGELIRIKLEFLKPFKATHTAEFTFEGRGDQTVVNWIMTGRNNFLAKVFGLLMDMDKMIGGDFETGLTAMRTAAETAHGGTTES
jgi:hypothetical protein